MKKLIVLVAVLLMGVTSVFAQQYTDIVEPQSGGPNVALQSVWNNGASTLDVGDVVIWDVDASTGDNDQWVATTTTADTYVVAGVVYPSDITAGSRGTIAVRGPVAVDVLMGLQTLDGQACTSTTAGAAGTCADNGASFGSVITPATSTGNSAANVCVNCSR